jgi:hypothetical protein
MTNIDANRGHGWGLLSGTTEILHALGTRPIHGRP